jgi:hypothetical protein
VGLDAKQQKTLDRVVGELRERLGERLESLVLYGSAVRGDAVGPVPDLNLLLLLRESRPEEHALVGEVIRGCTPPIEPFILGRPGFERSARCFAVKLCSIARHYRVLHGPDPLAGLEIPVALRRFLAEQSLRNLRLRLAHLFATRGDAPRAYAHWLVESTAAIFTDLCEPLRLAGSPVPEEFAERLPELETFYSVGASGLLELLALRARPRRLTRRAGRAARAHLRGARCRGPLDRGALAAAGERLMLRCPHCGKDFTPREARAPGEKRPSCPWCGRSFPASIDAGYRPTRGASGVRQTVLVGITAACAFASYAMFASQLKGPQFLAYYVGLLLVLLFARALLEDDLARLAPLVLFELVGLWRFVDGLTSGMHRFTYLFLLMLLGGFFLAVNATSFPTARSGRYSRSSHSRSSCSSGSFFSSCSAGSSGCSSGGGGCGGGGGGCGGCGG